MADIVNPQAVVFCNEKARVFAECLLSTIGTARALKADYDANTLDTLFPNTADKVVDGSAVDGRPPVTGAAVRALYTAASDILTWAAVGTPTREARLRAFTNRGESRF